MAPYSCLLYYTNKLQEDQHIKYAAYPWFIFHGQVYPQGGWSCVPRSRNLVIHAYAVHSLKPYHQCDHLPISQHLLKFYWAASQRSWFGATWNLKQKAQWNTFKISCSQVLSLKPLKSPRVKLLSIHDDYAAILMKHKSIDILGFVRKRKTQIHLKSSWNMSWHLSCHQWQLPNLLLKLSCIALQLCRNSDVQ